MHSIEAMDQFLKISAHAPRVVLHKKLACFAYAEFNYIQHETNYKQKHSEFSKKNQNLWKQKDLLFHENTTDVKTIKSSSDTAKEITQNDVKK